MSGAHLLLVEDDTVARVAVAENLVAHGYAVVEAATAADAFRAWDAARPDLILLDLGLPDLDGLTIIRRVRREAATPILVLSARGREADKIEALEAGADDYVTKPFGIDELLARLRALLRRAAPSSEPVIDVGELTVDLEKRIVLVRGAVVQVTPIEFDLLSLFARNEGKLLTHRTILREVWGPAYGAESHYLHVYVSQLRRKLELDPTRPRHLLTEPGAGYRLVAPSGSTNSPAGQ